MEIVPESKLWPVEAPNLLSDAPKMTRKPSFLSRIHWKYQYFHEISGDPELVGALLLSRFGQTDTLEQYASRSLHFCNNIGHIYCGTRRKSSKRGAQYRVFRVL